MAVNRNNLTPLSKGGARTAHTGKGSKQAPMGMRHTITQSGAMSPGATPNNYAKATPMANPAPQANQGLGSGSFPGVIG
jgi:hypothetical protein